MPPKRKRAAKESASGDAPIGGRNNGCYRAQQVIFDDLVTPHAPYTVQTTQAVPTPSPEEKSSRLRSQEMKLDVLQQYTAWIAIEHHEFAIEHRDQDFERIVVIDQKWFCEGKTKMALQYQERPDHPIPRELKFIPKKAETKTQEKKIMVLCAVSENTCSHAVFGKTTSIIS